MSGEKLGFSLRFTICKKEKFFGPGVLRLLKEIEKTGSINAACREMDMSYTKGWRILGRAEEEMGFKFIVRKTGGSGGGASVLTDEGRAFMENYEKMLADLKKEGERLFDRYFTDIADRG